MKKYDFVLIILILAASAALFAAFSLNSRSGKYAVITLNGADYMTLPLDTDTTVRIPETGGNYNIITIKGKQVTVSDSDCPDRICVGHASISITGETIICLPHRLSVRITGGKDSGKSIDGTAY